MPNTNSVERNVAAKVLLLDSRVARHGGATPLTRNTVGIIALEQESETEPVSLRGQISGLTPGKHGFHIHTLGNLEDGCDRTGGNGLRLALVSNANHVLLPLMRNEN